MEAFSRGASFVTMNDLSGECVETIRKNLAQVGEVAEIYQMDAFALLETLQVEKPYDIILLHPPYPIGEEGYLKLIETLKSRKEVLCHEETSIFLEVPGKLEKALTPVIKEAFHIKKCKGRSTWALFHLLV